MEDNEDSIDEHSYFKDQANYDLGTKQRHENDMQAIEEITYIGANMNPVIFPDAVISKQIEFSFSLEI